jgi:hypothetical protein
MTAAIKGTFPVKKREHNGLERVADAINRDRLTRVYVVAVVEWHAHRETTSDDVVTFNVAAVEPACNDDGTENAYTPQVRKLLDRMRKDAGKGLVAETLFSMPPAEIEGQTSIDDHVERPEAVRDGRDVPPPDGDEIMAKRAEDAKSKVVDAAAAVAANDKAARPTKSTPAPVTFEPGGKR